MHLWGDKDIELGELKFEVSETTKRWQCVDERQTSLWAFHIRMQNMLTPQCAWMCVLGTLKLERWRGEDSRGGELQASERLS